VDGADEDVVDTVDNVDGVDGVGAGADPDIEDEDDCGNGDGDGDGDGDDVKVDEREWVAVVIDGGAAFFSGGASRVASGSPSMELSTCHQQDSDWLSSPSAKVTILKEHGTF
jgi:hypothetical protein